MEYKIVYIVEMLRYGERESHSYVMGVFSDRKIAEYEAQIHMLWRAGKYDAEIRQEVINGVGRGLVCYLDEVEMSEENLLKAIKKRQKKLKEREKAKEEYSKNYLGIKNEKVLSK